MATQNKFNQFTKDLVDGVHDFDAHTFKIMLTNVAPSASNATKSAITEIAAGNGYTAGGATVSMSTSTSGGVAKITATDVVFTATGNMAEFQWAVLYNDTPTSPADPLISWVEYPSKVNLTAGETFTIDFDGTNGLITI